MGDDPWLVYEKRRLAQGWTHPLQVVDVAEALRTAGVTVGRFARSGAAQQGWWGMEAVALHVHRYGDSVVREWGPHDPTEQVGLAVTACPSDLRTEVRAALISEGLPRAVRWLAALADRGEGWSASTHRFEVRWRAGSLIFVEDESHSSLWRTETDDPGLSWWRSG